MTTDLADLQPALLWRYFLALSRIPRASKQEAAAAEWCAEQGRALGCQVERDEIGNVLIRKAATPGYEQHTPLALQAHVDMVCEKNEGTLHDFAVDPIDVYRDGEVLRARGTTLGADNGIGVATALAVLASPDIQHGPLEVLITVDEETGLTGAHHLAPGWLKANCLINLDSEEEADVTIGCAGGMDTLARRTVSWQGLPSGHSLWRIKVFGLKGGHSGIDIDAHRGNALKVLGQTLDALDAKLAWELAFIHGGNKRNAIAREAHAIIAVPRASEAELQAIVANSELLWQTAFGAFEPGLQVSLSPASAERCLSAADRRAIVGLLLAGPHGVEAMSPAIPGLVQTSTNMGLISLSDTTVEVCFASRSAIDSSKRALVARVSATARLAGFEALPQDGYPGWKPEPGAPLVQTIVAANQKLYGKPMGIKAIHAGLECGLIGEKYPDVQMASIGPDMWDVHTPDEHVNIASVGRFWQLLVAVLADL